MARTSGSNAGRSWRSQPAGWGWAVLVAVVVLLAPLWLWLDPLDGYAPRDEGLAGLVGRLGTLGDPFGQAQLQLDDFDYVAKSRTLPDLSRHLLTPHNTHVVPLFRIWTAGWVWLAGSLARTPEMLGLAGYVTYVLAMLLVGHVVAWESGNPALGLGVMAALGVSAVLEPTVRWYAASQALMAGVPLLASLAALQRWRAWGGWWWLAAAVLATAGAPLFWSGGYVAGPAGLAYLLADRRPHIRRRAWLPLAASALVALGAYAVAGRAITAAGNFHDRSLGQAVNPVQGAISTVQGVVEVLMLRNLGLDAVTSPPQALALALLALGGWVWWRGRSWRPGPLEATGGVTAVLGFLIVYTARGYFTFDSLRDLSWYQAIPQLGAALFAAGVILGRSRAQDAPPRGLGTEGQTLQARFEGRVPGAKRSVPRDASLQDPGHAALRPGQTDFPFRTLDRPTRGGLVAVLGVVVVCLVLQTPRVRARVVATAEPLSASEQRRFPIARLQRLRARYLADERVAWQRRFLARLDRAETLAREARLGRDVLRSSLGHVVGPGMPTEIAHIDGVNMMALPESGMNAKAGAVLESLEELTTPELEPRPPWLGPLEPWPPQAKRPAPTPGEEHSPDAHR